MPYRARGKIILIKRRGKWVRYRVAKSSGAAQRQATALNMRHAKIPPKKKRKRRKGRRTK